jgi:hypothetical protein
MELLNYMERIVVDQPTWAPSANLKVRFFSYSDMSNLRTQKNINHYVHAASLSTSLQSFRGRSTVTLIIERLLDLGFDIPQNIRHDAAAMSNLTKAVEETFTNHRSKMKKMVRTDFSKRDSHIHDHVSVLAASIQPF